MEKNRKDIENEILNEERMGEEEDYEEYARLREEREGIRSRKERIAQEEQRRQAMEYERIRNKEAQERQAREEQKKISSYERRKKKKHPIRNFVLDQNIALFGVDSREQDLLGGNNRSDSIMICSINKKTGEIKLASVYRDTLLDIGGGEYRKCNAAYAFGGPQQAVAMLNTNLDLNITDFVTVGFEGLADTIDALGGIDLEITEEEMEYMNSYMEDMYYEIGTEYDELTDWGMQHLSGIQATAYCRIRYTVGDDFKRAQRQRTVLALTMQKAKEAGPIRLIAAANAALGETATSLNTGELFRFILRAKTMDLTESTGFPTEEDRIFATIGGESCVVPYYLTTNVKELHRTLFGQDEYEPSSTVNEINDTINSYVN